MDPSGPSNTTGPPSSGDLILQQRKDAVQTAAQSTGDGSFLSQFSNNPFFTAVWPGEWTLNMKSC